MTARIGIVGSGISGVAAAETLLRQGHRVCLMDMGGNPGGRMAVRDLAGTGTSADGEVVDLGAAYFTVSSADFGARVADWVDRGLARAWFDTCTVVDAPPAATGAELAADDLPQVDDQKSHGGSQQLVTRIAGPTRFTATRGTRSLVLDLLDVLSATKRLELRLGTRVAQVRGAANGTRPRIDGDDFDAVILAMPDAQATRILDLQTAPALFEQLDDQPWLPVLSHIMAFHERHWAHDDFWFINNSEVIASIADNSRRRGSDNAVLVAHSTSELAREFFDNAEDAAPAMTAAVGHALGFTASPAFTLTRRWGLAHPAQPREEPCGWDSEAKLAVCGDGWHGKPRIEAAWLSGKAASVEVLAAVGD